MNAEVFSYSKEDYPESDRFIFMNVYTPLKSSKKKIGFSDLIDLIKLGFFHSFSRYNNSNLYQSFRIDFFDYIDCGSLLDYLQNKNSDYRLTRLSDGVIIRPCHRDVKRIIQDLADLSSAQSYTLGFELPDNPNKKEVRKIISRFRRQNRN